MPNFLNVYVKSDRRGDDANSEWNLDAVSQAVILEKKLRLLYLAVRLGTFRIFGDSQTCFSVEIKGDALVTGFVSQNGVGIAIFNLAEPNHLHVWINFFKSDVGVKYRLHSGMFQFRSLKEL